MVTYDTVGMVVEKTNYLMQRKLGGGMWWEASGDKGDTNARKADGSLIGTFVETVNASGNAMSRVPNALNYPESQYDNLRAKFPGQ
jgi:chitinase